MYWKRIRSPLILFLLLGFFTFNQRIAKTDSTNLRVLSTSANSIQFELHSTAAIANAGSVTIDGIETALQQAGSPMLPYYSAMVALPPLADVSLTVAADNISTQTINGITPAPSVVGELGRVENLQISGIEELPAAALANADIYEEDALYPASWYEISAPIQSRDLRYVIVKIFPTRFNPVTNQLKQAAELHFTLNFTNRSAADAQPLTLATQQALAKTMLNPVQALQWGHIPAATASRTAGVTLPIGQQAVKIEVLENGIYELSRADLQAAGMNININPNTIEMMYRGESVAYQFIGDGDSTFESNEKIRFYGWAFDSSREEQLYVNNNVFWLWANGASQTIPSVANTHGFATLTQYRATKVTAPRNAFSPTYTSKWDQFEADPDLWYWDYFKKSSTGFTPEAFPFIVDLSAPAAGGSDATFSVEYLTSFESDQNISIDINGARRHSNQISSKSESVTIHGTVAQASLLSGNNQFDIIQASYGKSAIFLNEISVEYWRNFAADSNYIEYELPDAGQHEVTISGFSSSSPVLAWEITDRLNPTAINVVTGDRSGGGPYNYRVASNHNAATRYAVSDVSQLLTPEAMSTYTAANIQPAAGAEWAVVTHPDFMAQANTLATHRATYSDLQTHVVNVTDIINQYGYGLALPEAIRDYFKHAVTTWTPSLEYVVLLGDATQNPLGLECPDADWCGATWSANETAYVPTYLLFEDRLLGLVPSDHVFSMIVGNDLTPDINVGRLAVQTSAEATIMINKIVQYENNLLTPTDSLNEVIFISDNTDGGGNFCQENTTTANSLPTSLNTISHCIATSAGADEDAAHAFLIDKINNDHFAILNYRGHGGINKWGTNKLLSTTSINEMTNANNPFVTLSADCLDGHFAWVNRPGMSESLLAYNGGGAAAHWGSTGLGYTFEHSILHRGFMDALYLSGLTRMGDAITASKNGYIGNNQDKSEVYAFTLQGDPAMEVMRPDLAVSMTAQAGAARADVTFVTTIENNNTYPAQTVLTQAIPATATVANLQLSASADQVITAGQVQLDFDQAIGYNESVIITMTLTVASYDINNPLIVSAEVSTQTGNDAQAPNDNAIASFPSVPLGISLTENSSNYHGVAVATLLILFTLVGVTAYTTNTAKRS